MASIDFRGLSLNNPATYAPNDTFCATWPKHAPKGSSQRIKRVSRGTAVSSSTAVQLIEK